MIGVIIISTEKSRAESLEPQRVKAMKCANGYSKAMVMLHLTDQYVLSTILKQPMKPKDKVKGI